MTQGSWIVRKLLTLLAALAAVAAVVVVPAGAITNGTPDNEGHPYVGLMVAKNAAGVPLWRCSGTLMSPTVFMVAGHCTEAPAASAVIWFSSGSPSGIPLGQGYPAAGANPCAGITGYPCTGDAMSSAIHTHPQYDPNAFYLHDLGIVELSSSVTGRGFGAVPAQGAVSRVGKHGAITAVGYGLQKSFPDNAGTLGKDQALRIRMVADERIKDVDNNYVGDFAFTTSFGANGGGTCFGDSGGPNFIGTSNVVGGVTSFGTTDTCKGHNGAYRVDQADDLAWLATFGLRPS
jgi:trypsin